MKRKQKQALYNLVAVVTVVLAVIGVRLCAHYVACDASVAADSITVHQGATQNDTATNATDPVVSGAGAAEKSKAEKSQGKRGGMRAKKEKKERSRPLERSFLDEEIPVE